MNSNWNYVPFNTLFNWCEKSNIGSRQAVEDGKYTLYIASATEHKRYNEYLHDGEALVFGTGGNPAIHYATNKFAYTNHTEAAVAKNDSISLKFYYYYFHLNKYEQLRSTFVGGGIKNSSKKKIGALLVPIVDFEEQLQIVEKIEELFSELDNNIETLKNTRKQLAVYRQAVLKEAFNITGDDIIDTDLDHIISVLTDYHANGSYENLKANVTLLDTPDYAIMVRSTNYEKNDFTDDVKYINKHSYDFLKKSQLFGGEVLMGKIGNAGRVYFTKKLDKPMSLAMNMFAMRFNEDVESKYVYYYLLSPTATSDIKKYVKGVGTPTIDKKSVRAIKIKYPKSKTHQQEIIKKLNPVFLFAIISKK